MDVQKQVVSRLRAAFQAGVTAPEEFRRAQLTQLGSMIRDNEEQIVAALHRDLGKPKFEAILSEVDIVMNELHHAISNMSGWMQPEYVPKNLATKLDDCFVQREPLGVVLIIGPWNYPLQLLIAPMVGAIAAGNCVVLKPSEISSATDSLVSCAWWQGLRAGASPPGERLELSNRLFSALEGSFQSCCSFKEPKSWSLGVWSETSELASLNQSPASTGLLRSGRSLGLILILIPDLGLIFDLGLDLGP
ncbi:unnamed protein product, partial [Menidia menidia]